MAGIHNDPSPSLRDELIKALAVLAPQNRGLRDLATTSISDELRAQVEEQIAARTHRVDLIEVVIVALNGVVTALNALDADGYPALPASPILGSLFSELQEENADLAAAMAVFASEQITAGPMTQTANPNPPTAAGP